VILFVLRFLLGGFAILVLMALNNGALWLMRHGFISTNVAVIVGLGCHWNIERAEAWIFGIAQEHTEAALRFREQMRDEVKR
jgi:hypothetical protein